VHTVPVPLLGGEAKRCEASGGALRELLKPWHATYTIQGASAAAGVPASEMAWFVSTGGAGWVKFSPLDCHTLEKAFAARPQPSGVQLGRTAAPVVVDFARMLQVCLVTFEERRVRRASVALLDDGDSGVLPVPAAPEPCDGTVRTTTLQVTAAGDDADAAAAAVSRWLDGARSHTMLTPLSLGSHGTVLSAEEFNAVRAAWRQLSEADRVASEVTPVWEADSRSRGVAMFRVTTASSPGGDGGGAAAAALRIARAVVQGAATLLQRAQMMPFWEATPHAADAVRVGRDAGGRGGVGPASPMTLSSLDAAAMAKHDDRGPVLVDVDLGSVEAVLVRKAMCRQQFGCIVERIQRVQVRWRCRRDCPSRALTWSLGAAQNEALWRSYAFRRRCIDDELASSPRSRLPHAGEGNELLLLHGSRATSPLVICREGFDFRVANLTSLYGLGTYFSNLPGTLLRLSRCRSAARHRRCRRRRHGCFLHGCRSVQPPVRAQGGGHLQSAARRRACRCGQRGDPS
jgi:hypothetical protein